MIKYLKFFKGYPVRRKLCDAAQRHLQLFCLQVNIFLTKKTTTKKYMNQKLKTKAIIYILYLQQYINIKLRSVRR